MYGREVDLERRVRRCLHCLTKVLDCCLESKTHKWACGTLGIGSPTLFQLLNERADWSFDKGSQLEIAKLRMRACYVANSHSPGFFSALVRCLDIALVEANYQDSCVAFFAIKLSLTIVF